MPCGWGGNRRSGVALAILHRLQWFIHLRAHGLKNTYTPHKIREWVPHFTLRWQSEGDNLCLWFRCSIHRWNHRDIHKWSRHLYRRTFHRSDSPRSHRNLPATVSNTAQIADWTGWNLWYGMKHEWRNQIQVTAVLTAKGCIADASYRITSAHVGYISLYFTMGRETSSKTVHSPWGIQMHGFLESTGVQSSNGASIGSAVFVQLTVLTNRQTHTEIPRYIGNNRRIFIISCFACNTA